MLACYILSDHARSDTTLYSLSVSGSQTRRAGREDDAMRRLIRQLVADNLMRYAPTGESQQAARRAAASGYAQPLVRAYLRREWCQPLVRELLGRYPPGHPYHQDNPILRFYPLAMTTLFVGMIVVSVVLAILR